MCPWNVNSSAVRSDLIKQGKSPECVRDSDLFTDVECLFARNAGTPVVMPQLVG